MLVFDAPGSADTNTTIGTCSYYYLRRNEYEQLAASCRGQ